MSMDRTSHEQALRDLLTKEVEVTEIDPETGAVSTNTITLEPAEDALQAMSLVIEHIIVNMELNGIQVTDPAGIIETYAAGVGTNGGALSGAAPVVGNVNKAVQILDMANPGTGLVS